jgi:hypothetical protein
VQQPVAQLLGFGLGQLAVEQQMLGPGDQVDRDQRQLKPGLVDREPAGREAFFEWQTTIVASRSSTSLSMRRPTADAAGNSPPDAAS